MTYRLSKNNHSASQLHVYVIHLVVSTLVFFSHFSRFPAVEYVSEGLRFISYLVGISLLYDKDQKETKNTIVETTHFDYFSNHNLINGIPHASKALCVSSSYSKFKYVFTIKI